MGTLVFKFTDALRRMVEHAAQAPTISPNMGQLFDPELRLPGSRDKDMLKVTADDVDRSKLPRVLWLVKDSGCYLMSPGDPPLLAGDPEQPERRLVVYAEGLGPDCEYEDLEDACGGEDFCETVDLPWLQNALATPGLTHLVVEMSETHFDMRASG